MNEVKQDIPDGAPTLPAYDTGYQYHLWCQYCGVWHMHGRGNGHRVAHCYKPDSPYKQTGYILELVGDMTPAIRVEAVRAQVAANRQAREAEKARRDEQRKLSDKLWHLMHG